MINQGKYSFHPYYKYFGTRAKMEMKKLKMNFPGCKIEHFGSTAVPGLGGKGIIDLYMLVPKGLLEKYSDLVRGLGYEFVESGGVVGERLFHYRVVGYKNGKKQKFHLHVTDKEEGNFRQCLAFRDLLIKRPDLAKSYSEIKQKAVIEASKFKSKKDKKDAYMRVKSPIIEEIVRLLEI